MYLSDHNTHRAVNGISAGMSTSIGTALLARPTLLIAATELSTRTNTSWLGADHCIRQQVAQYVNENQIMNKNSTDTVQARRYQVVIQSHFTITYVTCGPCEQYD